MVQLKSCPFCGGRAVYSRIPGHGFSVLCQGCGALAVHTTSANRDALGNAWNRREVRHNFNQKNRQVKPCPFCATQAGVRKMPDDQSVLLCERCGLMVSFVYSLGLRDTVNHWNQRVQGG